MVAAGGGAWERDVERSDAGATGGSELLLAPVEHGAFRTPTVRNAALTAPYMHDGSLKTLRQVIDHYEKASNEKEKHPAMSIFMLPFKLNEDEKKDLEVFMHALTGDKRDPRAAVIPVLPQ